MVWLRADLGTTIATGVSAWADKSGSGNSCTQATSAQQPTLNASDSSYGNQATLSFSAAANQVLTNTTLVLSLPYTVFVVGESDAATASGFFGDQTDTAGVVYTTTGKLIQMFNGSALAGTASVATPSAIAAVFNGASSSAYVNSSATPNVTGSAGTSSFAHGYQLGASGAPSQLQGKIAEVLVYTGALSQTSIAQIFRYFATRYALSGVS